MHHRFMDVITTSGPEAHVPPDESKLTSMREGCDTTPLCRASTGLTAEDLRGLKGEIDAFILQMDDSVVAPSLRRADSALLAVTSFASGGTYGLKFVSLPSSSKTRRNWTLKS